MKRIIVFMFVFVLFSGCATLSTSQMVETTKSQGVEHIFNHPYKNVFYACEDVLEDKGGGQFGTWNIKKSDTKKGIIEAHFMGRKIIIIVEKIAKDKTLVKAQKFGLNFGIRKDFFKDVERLASRDYYN